MQVARTALSLIASFVVFFLPRISQADNFIGPKIELSRTTAITAGILAIIYDLPGKRLYHQEDADGRWVHFTALQDDFLFLFGHIENYPDVFAVPMHEWQSTPTIKFERETKWLVDVMQDPTLLYSKTQIDKKIIHNIERVFKYWILDFHRDGFLIADKLFKDGSEAAQAALMTHRRKESLFRVMRELQEQPECSIMVAVFQHDALKDLMNDDSLHLRIAKPNFSCLGLLKP